MRELHTMPSTELKMLRRETEKELERTIAAEPTSLMGANPDVEALETG